MCNIAVTVTNSSTVVIAEIHYSWKLTTDGAYPADTTDTGLALANTQSKVNTITETVAGNYNLRVLTVSDGAISTGYTLSTFQVLDDADCP